MNIRAYIWDMNNAQNNSTMTSTSSLRRSKPRQLTCTYKGLQTYKFKSNDYCQFTISKYDGKWELYVESTFKQQMQGGDITYVGTFYFDRMKDAKVFAESYYSSKWA